MAEGILLSKNFANILRERGSYTVIDRAADPELLNECRLLGGCKTGQAKLVERICVLSKEVIMDGSKNSMFL